jgi:hypothetical protein
VIADYAALAEMATDLIADYGRAVTLRHRSASVVNAASGVATRTSTDYVTTGVLLRGRRDWPSDLVEARAHRIHQTPTLGAVPEPGDQVLVGSDVWEVLSVEATCPATTTLLYQLAVQRGG